MTRNYQLWEEKQRTRKAWTGHGRMQEVRPQQTCRGLLDFTGFRIFIVRQMNSCFSAGWQWNYFCSQNFPLNTTHSTKLVLQLQPARSSVHFRHCAPGLGTPNWVFNTQQQVSSGGVSFFSQSMNWQWWHKVSPTAIMVQVGAVIPWELGSGSLMSPRDRNGSSHGTAACVEESKAPQSGGSGERSHPVHALKRKEGRDHSCNLSFSSTIYTCLWETSLSTMEFLRLKSDFTHIPGRALLVAQHHPGWFRLLFEVTDFISLPQTR